MPAKRSITVVTACSNASHVPDFALTTVEVTQSQVASGDHYPMVEDQLTERGYDPPFVHFDTDDAPDFLLPAVRQYLRVP